MIMILDGEPIAQTRMRYSGRNGIGRIYDPREREKRKLKELIVSKHNSNASFVHPRVCFVFHMPIPKSVPKRLLPTYRSGLLKHEKKPDADNFIKLYLDCLDGICFEGDQKVSLGPCVKLYHPHPKTIIIISEMQEILSAPEVDPETWQTLFGQECGRCSSSAKACPLDSCGPLLLEPSQSPGESSPGRHIQPS